MKRADGPEFFNAKTEPEIRVSLCSRPGLFPQPSRVIRMSSSCKAADAVMSQLHSPQQNHLYFLLKGNLNPTELFRMNTPIGVLLDIVLSS
jgi:hypothetical protein